VLTLETPALLDGGAPGVESRRGRVEIRYVATDAKRRLYPEIRHIGTLSMSSREAEESAGQLRILSQLELPEGRYQIRMAAGGSLGAGSLVYDFEVPDFNTERMTMSGVSLTTVSAARLPTLHAARIPPGKTRSCYNGDACNTTKAVDVALTAWSPDNAAQEDPLYKALPAPPTTARAFARTETVAIFSEVYSNPKAGDTALSGTALSVTAELRRADQSSARRISRELSQRDKRRSGGYGVTLTLPLSGLEPGRYLLHVEARSSADNQTTARDIPLDIVP